MNYRFWVEVTKTEFYEEWPETDRNTFLVPIQVDFEDSQEGYDYWRVWTPPLPWEEEDE